MVCYRYYLRRATELKMDSRVIAELILHLGRIASREALVEGLTPAQWAVLRYFARANRFSRTPSAFAAFHGTTRGTASQTIKSLESQAYLTRVRSQADGRSARLDLTDKARAILAHDPLEALVRAADALPPGARGHFGNGLRRMLGQVATQRGKPPFGTCGSCEHLEGDGRSRDGQPPYACGFAREPLPVKELDHLCVNFVPGKPLTAAGAVTAAAPR
jgi:DNA-binding MarR family transcriptional regulator